MTTMLGRMSQPGGALLALALILLGCTAAPATGSPTLLSSARISEAPPESAGPSLVTTVEDADEAPTGAIEIVMTQTSDGPRFQPDEVTARAGRVVLFLRNDPASGRPVPHNLLLGLSMDQALAQTRPLPPNAAVVMTIEDVPVGTYTYWCTVLASSGDYIHAAQGMVGTLTVTP